MRNEVTASNVKRGRKRGNPVPEAEADLSEPRRTLVVRMSEAPKPPRAPVARMI